MEPFDLEKAKQGRQIVHRDGRRAVDWHIFEIYGGEYLILCQFGDLSADISSYLIRVDGTVEPEVIGLAPKRVVRHVVLANAADGSGPQLFDGYSSLETTKKDYRDGTIFKVSCNPDGSDPTIERIDHSVTIAECSVSHGGSGVKIK